MNEVRIVSTKIWFIGFGILCVFIALLYFWVSIKRKRIFDIKRPHITINIPKENMKKEILDNGMTVLVFENRAVPKVLLQIAYEVGSAVEQAGEKGLAHLIEHMIFKGTEKLSEGDIDAIARKFGATYNAFTSKDVTSYYFEVNKNNWQPFVGILADCMQNSRFDANHLASEMRAVIQELRMYKDNYWQLMFQKASSMIFPANHPYHYPIIGYKEDLTLLTAEKLKNFYKKYYHPQKATLFVVGDVNADEIIEKVKKEFGLIPEGKMQPEDQHPVLYEMETEQVRIYQNVKSDQLGLFWRIPGRKKIKETLVDAVALILGQGEGSRLYKRLVDEEKIASSVYVDADQLIHDGIFMVLVEPHQGKTELCKESILDELHKIIKTNIEQEEFEKIVVNKQRTFLELMEQHSSFAYAWIRSYFTTHNENDVFNVINEYEELKRDDIHSFISSYLDPFFVSQITLLPLPDDKKEKWKALRQEEEKIERALVEKTKRTTNVEDAKFVYELSAPLNLDFKFPKPSTSFTLSNGLQVFMRQESQWPLISVSGLFRDGNFYGFAREGISVDIMMDMLIEGSKNFDKKDHVIFFERFGVSYSFSSSGFALSMLNKEYEPVFERFFHILTQPKFKTESLKKLKAIFVDVYTRAKDDPMSVANRILQNQIYNDHPYQWTFDNAIDLVNDLDINLLSRLHTKIVAPEHMAISIVGDFDLKTMQDIITKTFSSWSGSEYQEREVYSRDFKQQKVDEVLLRDQVVLALGRPSPITIDHNDYIPLKLLNIISFYSLGSRLYQLREQTGLFYTARGTFAAQATKQPGIDFVKTILNRENIDKAETGIKSLINEIGEKGVTQQELDSARQLYIKNLIDLVSINQATATLFSQLEILNLGHDYYDKALDRVQKISREELNSIAKKYFTDKNFSRVRVGRF